MMGRLKPAISSRQAQDRLDALAASLRAAYPVNYPANAQWALRLEGVQSQLTSRVRPLLGLLMGAVGLLLAIACVNIANLTLARASSRAREIAVRRALGATRGQLVRQLLVESLVVAVAGGVGALAALAWSRDWIVAMLPADLPRLPEVQFDGGMHRTTRFFLAVVVGLLAVTIPAFAQTALGTLRGIVRDQQGGALPGVTVTVRQVETNTATTAVTGAEGQFFQPNLRPGRYEVTAELASFVPVKQSLELRVGQDLTVTFSMKLGGIAETVDVVARSVPVETQSTLATIITNKQIDDLPTIARNFSALATLSPGATTSTATGTGQGTGVSISGQRPFSNGIVVDGASNQMQFYGRQANDFPQDWIQEFQVLTNSFSAEFGQAAGGMSVTRT